MQRSLFFKIYFFLIILSIFCTGTQAYASTDTQTSIPLTKLFYFKDNTTARASLFAHPSSIDILAPQAYKLDATGTLSGGIDPTILAFTKKNNIKVMPLVTNGNFSKSVGDSLLDDTSIQDTAINALITEAKTYGYIGWQIDFEGIDSTYRNPFSEFVQKAHIAMNAEGLSLSVAVIAQTSDNGDDYPRNLWSRVIGVYDYGALAQSADFVSVMSYDDPTSTGPVTPYPWLKEVLAYSLKYIPANKLSLGIPLYYWEWNDKSGKLVSVGGYTGVQKILKTKHSTIGFSSINEAPFIKYSVKKNHYTLWYENERSIHTKINLIKQYKLVGFSAWVLGLEDPSVYAAMK